MTKNYRSVIPYFLINAAIYFSNSDSDEDLFVINSDAILRLKADSENSSLSENHKEVINIQDGNPLVQGADGNEHAHVK